jgi:hypothetical protein
MALELSFDEQFSKLKYELITLIEIGRDDRLFLDYLVPGILELEEALYYHRGPYAKYRQDVLQTYFQQIVEPNWSKNEKFLIPSAEVNQDAIVARPAIGFICGMTLNQVNEGLKVPVELTFTLPPEFFREIGQTSHRVSFPSSQYALTISASKPPTKHDVYSVGLKMNDFELQQRLWLETLPTKPISDTYWLKRI